VNQALPQYVPSFFATFNLDSFGMDGFALGAGFFAPHAGDYQFPDNETTRYTLIDRDLYELFYSVTLAYRFLDWLSIGGSLQGVTSGLKQQIKISADPYGNENPDSDILIELEGFQHFIPSGNFGVWSELLPGLELGSSVQLGRQVEATGPLRLLEFGPGVEELMASDGTAPPLVEIEESNPEATVRFTMPPFYRTGLKYSMEKLFGGLMGFDVELDFVYEQWSVFDHISVESKGVGFSFSGGESEPLAPIIQPKNYNDCWSVRLGGQVDFLDRLVQLRSGIFYETAAIPDETYTVELQNGEKVGVGMGVSLQYWGVRLDLGYAHLFLADRVVGEESIIHVENTAPPTLSPGERRTRVAMGQYSASYDMLTVAVNIAFDEMLGFGVVDKAPWEKSLIPGLGD
jgi:long-subunit fatty acid transport protein